MNRILAVSLIIFLSLSAEASIRLPTGLDSDHRQQTLRILGLSMSDKTLSDPYPLGGFAGFEIGIALENIPASELQNVDTKAQQPDVTFPKVSLAKGVYNNIDLFLNFAPYSQRTDISQYGGSVRWGFYQGVYFPVSLSTAVHVNNTNINNQLSLTTLGLDLTGGLNIGNLAIFTGGGVLQTSGIFGGGLNGLTAPEGGAYTYPNQETETLSGLHVYGGLGFHLQQAFMTVELDRSSVMVYTGKLGVRF